MTPQNPKRILRSSLFSLKSVTYFYCNVTSYNMFYTWSLLNNSTDILSMNPTKYSSELVIQSNQLEYGLYEFKLQVQISSNGIVRATSKFVEIIPTDIAVYGLFNGVLGIVIGSRQFLTLDPVLFSTNLDEIGMTSSMNFTFIQPGLKENAHFVLF